MISSAAAAQALSWGIITATLLLVIVSPCYTLYINNIFHHHFTYSNVQVYVTGTTPTVFYYLFCTKEIWLKGKWIYQKSASHIITLTLLFFWSKWSCFIICTLKQCTKEIWVNKKSVLYRRGRLLSSDKKQCDQLCHWKQKRVIYSAIERSTTEL